MTKPISKRSASSSLTDLLAAVSPQTGSGRGRGGGRPVILLNGQRVSDFREMRNFPSEAVRRMEVLPEEVALRYGFRPDQRVVNMILKNNFSSKTVDGEYNIPTRGGFGTWEGQASLMRIDGANRLNLAFYVEDTSLLTEAERGVVQSAPAAPVVAGDPDPAAFRSLLADTRDIGLNGTWSKGLGERGMDGSISLNASIFRNDSQTLSGLDTVLLTAPGGAQALRSLGDPLFRTSRTETIEAGATLNKRLGEWQLNATLNGSHAKTNTLIDRRADVSALIAAASAGTLAIGGPLPVLAGAGADRAQTWNDSATSLVTLTGRPLRLPAGEAVLTVKGGFAYTGLRSNDTRTLAGDTRLKRGDLSGGVNLALPVASRRDNVLAGIGDLSLNFSAGVNRLSDFGTLTDWSAGLTWSPLEKLSLQASYIVNEAAPSLANLGNPLTQTFNVTIYDFARGENALITVINGGNRALLREKQRDLKLSATWELPFLNNSNLIAEYFRNRSNDVTASFPLLTPAIEAAFPGPGGARCERPAGVDRPAAGDLRRNRGIAAALWPQHLRPPRQAARWRQGRRAGWPGQSPGRGRRAVWQRSTPQGHGADDGDDGRRRKRPGTLEPLALPHRAVQRAGVGRAWRAGARSAWRRCACPAAAWRGMRWNWKAAVSTGASACVSTASGARRRGCAPAVRRGPRTCASAACSSSICGCSAILAGKKR